MTEALQQEIRTLKNIFESERDPQGRAFAPLADAYRRVGQVQEAVRLLGEGLARHPDFVPGHVVAAQLYVEQGLAEEAGIAARRALELDPENVNALRALLTVLEHGGDAEAAEVQARLMALDPGYGTDMPAPALGGGTPGRPPEVGEGEVSPAVPADVEPEVQPAQPGDLEAGLDVLEVPSFASHALPGKVQPGVEADEPNDAEVDLDLLDLPSFASHVSPGEERVVSMADLAPAAEEEEVVAMVDLAPAAEEEEVVAMADLAPAVEEEEVVVAMADLAPAVEEEEVVATADLAPAAEEEEVIAMADLAPAAGEEEVVVAMGNLAPDVEVEDLVISAVDTSAGEPGFDLDALGPAPEVEGIEEDMEELEPTQPAEERERQTARTGFEVAHEIVIDLDALAPSRFDAQAEAETQGDEEPSVLSEDEDATEGPEDGGEAAPTEAVDSDDVGEPVFTRTLAELYVKQGAVDKAAEVYRHLIERKPGDPELIRRLEELESGAASVEDSVTGGEQQTPPAVAVPTRAEPTSDGEQKEAGSGSPTIDSYFDGLLGWKPRKGP